MPLAVELASGLACLLVTEGPQSNGPGEPQGRGPGPLLPAAGLLALVTARHRPGCGSRLQAGPSNTSPLAEGAGWLWPPEGLVSSFSLSQVAVASVSRVLVAWAGQASGSPAPQGHLGQGAIIPACPHPNHE